MAIGSNHVVRSSRTEWMYDQYSCSYKVRSEIQLSDCVMAELNMGKQAALKEYAQRRLNDATQDINRMAMELIRGY